MLDDVMDPNDSGMLELAWRLEAYADARLTPSATRTIRMRTQVMNLAHRRAALIAADARSDTAGRTTAAIASKRARMSRRAWHRAFVAGMAALLAVALMAGTALGAKPGGPFYSARIWIEMANLPAGLVARAEAEISRLEARLVEAQQASAADDGPAVEAALSAYASIVIEAARDSAGDPTARAAIEVTVSRHVMVLTLMVDTVPAPARLAIQRAISSSEQVLDDLHGSGAGNGQDRRGGGDDSGLAGPAAPGSSAKPSRPERGAEGSPATVPDGQEKIKGEKATDPTKVPPSRDPGSRHPVKDRPGAPGRADPVVSGSDTSHDPACDPPVPAEVTAPVGEGET
jgi:hypothetical protein